MQEQQDKMSARGASVEALMEMQADLSPIPQFRSDKFGAVTWVNRAYLELTGRELAQLLGCEGINAIVPADRRRVNEAWDSAIEDERALEEEYGMVDAEGAAVRVRCRAMVTVDKASGAFLGHTGRLMVLGQ